MDDTQYTDRLRSRLYEITYATAFNNYIGCRWVELTKEYAKARMDFKQEVLNPYGGIHGGALLAFADTIAGTTACMCCEHYVYTVSSNLNFLMAARDTDCIYCECRPLRTGRRIVVMDVKITDNKGNLLDSGEYTYYISDNRVIQ